MPQDPHHALDLRSRRRLNRALRAGWRVMLWERSAVLWAPFLIATLALLAVTVWGAFATLTRPLQLAAVGGAYLIALVFAVHGALKIRLPKRAETTRRLELDSGFEHAPVSLLADRPVVGDPALWAVQAKQAAEAVRTLRVGRARAGLAAADPFALRYALLIAVGLALWARGPEPVRAAVLDFRPAVAVADAATHAAKVSSVTINSWIARIADQSSAAMPGKARSRPAASRP